MRVHKSYLCAHLSWMNPNQEPLCSCCEEADENFSHAILYCLVKSAFIEEFFPRVLEIKQFWALQALLLQLALFIYGSHTCFPIKNFLAASPLFSLNSSSTLTSVHSSVFLFPL